MGAEQRYPNGEVTRASPGESALAPPASGQPQRPTRTGAERRAAKYRHSGRWILLDARFHLLAIDSATYPGTSPTNTLDMVVRRILLPRIRSVSLSKQPLTETVTDHHHSWAIHIEPLLGAHSGQLAAVASCYWPAATAMPDPPLVGSWEWRVTPPGPQQQMRAYWSDSLYPVYDMAVPDGDGPHGWEGTQWLDEVVVEADRAETRRVQESLFRATSDALRFLTLRVRSPRTGQIFRIRTAARRDVAAPGPDIWLRGVSQRIDDPHPDEPPPAGPLSYLEAWFALTADPVCAIDTTYEQMFLTSAQFATLTIELPAHRHLPHMCHPEDLPTLRALLHQATTKPNTPVGPMHARFRGTASDWITLQITGVGVWPRDAHTHHVLCRVTTADRPGVH